MTGNYKRTWFRVYRSITESAVFDDPDVLKVWIWMLCKAYYCDTTVLVGKQEVKVSAGQVLFSRRKASEELKMSENKVYRIVKLLEQMECISIEAHSRFSLIFIVKWDFFQGDKPKFRQQTDSSQTANRQHLDTNNNINKNNNINNIYNTYVPTPKSTKFSNFTQGSKIDYKKLELDALRKRLERSRSEQ